MHLKARMMKCCFLLIVIIDAELCRKLEIIDNCVPIIKGSH